LGFSENREPRPPRGADPTRNVFVQCFFKTLSEKTGSQIGLFEWLRSSPRAALYKNIFGGGSSGASVPPVRFEISGVGALAPSATNFYEDMKPDRARANRKS
jgi:hypothetical protein